MAKNLKLHIKNIQLAEAIDLQGLKAKLGKKISPSQEKEETQATSPALEKSKKPSAAKKAKPKEVVEHEEPILQSEKAPIEKTSLVTHEVQSSASMATQEETIMAVEPVFSTLIEEKQESEVVQALPSQEESPTEEKVHDKIEPVVVSPLEIAPIEEPVKPVQLVQEVRHVAPKSFLSASRENPDQLGPVLQHRELLQPTYRTPRDEKWKSRGRSHAEAQQKSAQKPLWEPLKSTQGTQYHAFSPHAKPQQTVGEGEPHQRPHQPKQVIEKQSIERKPREERVAEGSKGRPPAKASKEPMPQPAPQLDEEGLLVARRKGLKESKEKEREREKEKEVRSYKKSNDVQLNEARLRRGLAVEKDDEGELWRKRRPKIKTQTIQEIEIVRPQEVSVRIPVSVKDLAQQMKLKASELITKLFMSGVVVTLNDVLDDATTIQFLGEEFGCAIHIDTAEEERLQITDKSIREEIAETPKENLKSRPPVVAFMGHVDHGKTSIIDKIRSSNRAQSEVGAITQHIGAFVCQTAYGPITILDTPGHEAFYQMRERGAELTDIVVLVVAGDEGMKQQTIEALNQAKESNATIVVAINKCDKPAFDQDMVFRQLADHSLLPEAWGGQTLTVRCSAVTGEGVDTLLEMLSLQSEVLELQANPSARARGTIIETEMHKGLGAVATLLVQNGTLRLGDSLVFETSFAKVKSMRDESGLDLESAGPSTAVRIHGLSNMPSAGEEFIVVPSEKEAKEIAEGRLEDMRQSRFQTKRRKSLESMMEQASKVKKKVLNLIIRADVQGSLEALCHALSKIVSEKVELNIISTGIGEVSESDVQLASASHAVIFGYHTQIEAHAEQLIKENDVTVRLHNIIYHAQDDVKELMKSLLDKVPNEVFKGKAEVKAIFKSSQLGNIAGCVVAEGSITRNCHARLRRGNEVLVETMISSLKRFKEDVREVGKGNECGIVLNNWNEYVQGDMIEAFDIEYLSQEL